jgi:hypothetical protein
LRIVVITSKQYLLPVVILGALITSGCAKSPETYDLHCSTPLEHWHTEKEGIGHLRHVMLIKMDAAGAVIWDNNKISDSELLKRMQDVNRFHPLPQMILDVNSVAPCDRVRVVRKIMDSLPICSEGYSSCSEGRGSENWDEIGQ